MSMAKPALGWGQAQAYQPKNGSQAPEYKTNAGAPYAP